MRNHFHIHYCYHFDHCSHPRLWEESIHSEEFQLLAALLAVVGEAVVENSGYDFDAHDGECCADGGCDNIAVVGDSAGAVDVQKQHAVDMLRDG